MWKWLGLTLLVAAGASGAAAPVQGATPNYLTEMPSARDVLANVHGRGPLNTWARRYATLERLVAILGELEGPREFNPSSAERRIGSEYRGNIGRLAAQVPQSERSKWFKRAWGYESNARFNRELMTRYFSRSVRAAYSKAHAANLRLSARKRAEEKAAAKRAEQQEQPGDPNFPLRVKIILGVLVVLVGLCGAGGRWVWVRF